MPLVLAEVPSFKRINCWAVHSWGEVWAILATHCARSGSRERPASSMRTCRPRSNSAFAHATPAGPEPTTKSIGDLSTQGARYAQPIIASCLSLQGGKVIYSPPIRSMYLFRRACGAQFKFFKLKWLDAIESAGQLEPERKAAEHSRTPKPRGISRRWVN